MTRFLVNLVACLLVVIPAYANTTTIVVQVTPGQPLDILMRRIASVLQPKIGTIVIENKFGAGGEIAARDVARSASDGTILGVLLNGVTSVYPHARQDLSTVVLVGLAPVTLLTENPYVFFVGPATPAAVRTPREYLDLVRQDEKYGLYGSPGQGTVPELVAQVFFKEMKEKTRVVRFRGSPDTTTNVLNGQVPSGFLTFSDVYPLHNPQLRMIAITGTHRMSVAANVPTFDELGFKGIPEYSWSAIMAPGETPKALREQWGVHIRAALSDPEIVAWAHKIGLTLKGSTPDELATFHKSEYDRWGKILSGIVKK